MNKWSVLLFFLFSFVSIYPQYENIRQFPVDTALTSTSNAQLIRTNDNALLMVWKNKTYVFFSKSYNEGVTWSSAQLLDSTGSSISGDHNLTGILTTSGTIYISYKSNGNYNKWTYSTDNGNSWNQPVAIPTTTFGNVGSAANSSFVQTEDGTLWYVYRLSSRFYNIKSSDNGLNWTYEQTMKTLPIANTYKDVSMTMVNNELILAFNEATSTKKDYDIYLMRSSDMGTTWSEPVNVFTDTFDQVNPRILKKNDGKLYLFYETRKPLYLNIMNYDIVYRISTNNGETWGDEILFSTYKGIDRNFNVQYYNDKFYLSFISPRQMLGSNYKIYYGIAEESKDKFTPPLILSKSLDKTKFSIDKPLIINAHCVDDSAITVKYHYSIDGVNYKFIYLYDDGKHNDSLPGDNIYGGILNGLQAPVSKNSIMLYSYIEASDNNNSAVSYFDNMATNPEIVSDAIYVDINRFKMTINNSGVLGAVPLPNTYSGGGMYDSIGVLFNGGFFLSGYTNANFWGNGMLSASHIADFLPGKIDDPNNNSNLVYVVKSEDPPFGPSWQLWKYAVQLGADFYDGDGDSIYNPVDKNNNGLWDIDEDKPDIIGDFTAWCVFNDGVESNKRRYNTVLPQGIEIQQTVFGWKKPDNDPLGNTLFVRYGIENKNPNISIFDSVYFTAGSDPDLGEYVDDLVGCDTLLNSGYCYNPGPDAQFGVNPPAFFTTLLQGAPTYIPGETFIDLNGDGKYTQGIDSALTNAYRMKGWNGIDTIPGAKNLPMTGFTEYISSHPTLGDPSTQYDLRNYQLGRDKTGHTINVCTWNFGNGSSLSNCASINPVYFYSGDPVTGSGWLNTTPIDQRMMINSGPFNIEKDKPVEIIYAYVVGRGSDHLNSVSVTRDYAAEVINFYKNNFQLSSIPPDNDQKEYDNFLSYNYPNPFNPVTYINFKVVDAGKVSLIVYDVLGREVAKLINEQKDAGSYSVRFDASKYSSGVYFYELKVNGYREIKKMLLLR